MEATLLMNQKRALVLDLRSAEDFGRARIPGARHLPTGELAKRIEDLARFKGRPVVLVGARPVSAMRALRAAGFTEIVQLRGGMNAWLEAGLPVQKA
jgi:rhodanese-related sulfurtransferase